MIFNDILNIHGTVSGKYVLDRVFDLGNKLYGKQNWKFNHSYDSETKTSVSDDKYRVSVGEKALYDGCNESECNKAAYVLLIKDIYHEHRHVWQYTKAWNDKAGLNSVKSYRQTTDMVRRKFVSDYFPSSYYNNYSNDPSEMDAEWYGIKMTLTYFKSDPMISRQEAEEILYQLMMSDDCVHREIFNVCGNKPGSIYGILNIFEERTKTVASVIYPLTDKIISWFDKDVSDESLSMTRDFLYSRDFKEYREAFNKCKTGIEQDKVLEQVILSMDNKSIRKSPLRLREELINCRRQMELDTPGTGPHAISPKHINYSICSTPDMENMELTEEDIAAIPTNDNMTI